MNTVGRNPIWAAIALLACAIACLASASGAAAAKAQTAHSGGGWIGLTDNQALSAHRVKPDRFRRAATDPDVLFRAERLSDFWLRQSAPGAITEAPDPAGSGQTVFKLTVGDGDVYPVTPTENPRAEMLSPPTIKASDEIWFSSKFFLPADFPSSIPGWMNVMQGPYGQPWDGPPPWHIEVNGSNLQWTRNSTYGWDIPWQMPLVRNRWVSVIVHEHFGADGWVEMWIDGQQVTFFAGGTYNPGKIAPTPRLAMATMDGSNNAAGNSVYLQSYRKAGMFGSLTSYEGPLTIGRTRASVES
jgi:hypothetical protein